MENCLTSISGRFPTNDLRFGYIPMYFVRKRSPKKPFFLPCIAAANSPQQTEPLESNFSNRMFILGMGFVGKFFAQNLKNQGWAVCGSCTSLMKKKKLQDMGFDAYIFDANEPEPEVLNVLNDHTHLLVSIPPLVGIGDPLLQHKELLRSRLMYGKLKWLCYLSSTGVYGNCGGVWVDEDYPVSPTDEKAIARLAAEEGWSKLGHDLGIPTQIFRLGGIYGRGRSAVDTIIKKESLSEIQKMRASRRYTSRVHVADICQALMASIYKPCQGKIFNVVDDDPAPRLEVFSYAQDLVDSKWPGYMKQIASLHGTKSFFVDRSSRGEKRVSNARIKKELGVRLFYPSYKSGLKSIVDQMDNPFF